ncbi:ankyrin repeat domain-containing protein [bacterium]|nr:ankyrin repeat domain-containing protein [bacterium]
MGSSILPLSLAVLFSGLILLIGSALIIGRHIYSKTVLPLTHCILLLIGLLFLDICLCGYFLLDIALKHSMQSRSVLPLKCFISFVIVVLVPVIVVLMFRRQQLSNPERYSQPGPRSEYRFLRPVTLMVIFMLVALFAFILLPLYGGWPPLMLAVRLGFPSLVSLCLNFGADVNMVQSRNSPLLVALEKGDPKTVEVLLAHGARTNSIDTYVPPLYYAAGRGNIELVTLLLRHGAEINTRVNDYGRTALIRAIMSGYKDIMLLLLEHGADLNIQCRLLYNDFTKSETTVLMKACIMGIEPAIKILLDHGADPTLKDGQGKTAYALALAAHQTEVVTLLQSYGISE